MEQLVWKHMQMVINFVTRYEDFFRAKMEQRLRVESDEILRVKRKQLDKTEKRILELDKLFVRIYEDNGTLCTHEQQLRGRAEDSKSGC